MRICLLMSNIVKIVLANLLVPIKAGSMLPNA